MRGTTHLKALKTRPGGDLDRACLMYELKRPLLTADSIDCEALRAILKLSDEDVDKMCDSNDDEWVELRKRYVRRLAKQLGYLLDMPEAGKELAKRLKDANADETAKLIKAWRRDIYSRNASLVEFSTVLAGSVRCNAPPLLLGAGAGNHCLLYTSPSPRDS